MRLATVDAHSRHRAATVNKNFSLAGEYVREAVWQDGEVTVAVEVIGYVSGIRARRNEDGSVDLLEQVSRFDVMGKDEFIQPIERAVFMWRRRRPGPDRIWIHEEDIDYSNEIGVVYQDTVEAAAANVQLWLDDLDFEEQFDPEAWEVPANA